MKECDRDTTGGVVAEEFDEATLLLLFKAARWERTFQTTTTTTTTKTETHRGSTGQYACSVHKQELTSFFRG